MKHPNLRFTARFVALVIASQVFFLVWYVASRWISPDPIVFYAGLRSLGYSALALVGLLYLLRRFLPGAEAWLGLPMTLPIVVIYLLAGYAFVITIPSLLDRSISVYLIAAVAQSGERGVTKTELQDGFVRDYVGAGAAVEKRLHEQLVSRNIAEMNGRYLITARGRWVYDVDLTLARILRIPGNYTEPPPLAAAPQ